MPLRDLEIALVVAPGAAPDRDLFLVEDGQRQLAVYGRLGCGARVGTLGEALRRDRGSGLPLAVGAEGGLLGLDLTQQLLLAHQLRLDLRLEGVASALRLAIELVLELLLSPILVARRRAGSRRSGERHVAGDRRVDEEGARADGGSDRARLRADHRAEHHPLHGALRALHRVGPLETWGSSRGSGSALGMPGSGTPGGVGGRLTAWPLPAGAFPAGLTAASSRCATVQRLAPRMITDSQEAGEIRFAMAIPLDADTSASAFLSHEPNCVQFPSHRLTHCDKVRFVCRVRRCNLSRIVANAQIQA